MNNAGSGKMSSEETILKAVFPLIDGTDLAACMAVCKQWGNVAQDNYLWKCICTKKWPSTSKENPSLNYRNVFKAYYMRDKSKRPISLAPGISLSDLEFYIDIWADGKSLLSEIAPGPDLREGSLTPPEGITPELTDHLEGPEYKLTFPIYKGLLISSTQEIRVSVLVARKDNNKVACIVNELIDGDSNIECSEGRAIAYAQIAEFPLGCPFVNFATSAINGEISLLFIGRGEVLDVFGIEINFLTAYAEEGVLWLLTMLDWK